jgi:hypothetical protein
MIKTSYTIEEINTNNKKDISEMNRKYLNFLSTLISKINEVKNK